MSERLVSKQASAQADDQMRVQERLSVLDKSLKDMASSRAEDQTQTQERLVNLEKSFKDTTQHVESAFMHRLSVFQGESQDSQGKLRSELLEAVSKEHENIAREAEERSSVLAREASARADA